MWKIITVVIILAVMAGAGVIAGCNGAPGIYNGSGKTVTQDYTFTDFNDIRAENRFQVEVTQSAGYSLSVTVDDNLVDRLDVTQSGSTIHIGMKPGIYTSANLKAKVTLPQLRRLDTSGTARATVAGFKSASSFESHVSGAASVSLDMEAGDSAFEVSGASHIEGNFHSGALKANISGASRVSVKGAGQNLTAEVSGASRLDLSDFPVTDARVNISGASSGNLNVSGRLDIDLSGASTLTYSGNPSLGAVNVTGGSRLEHK